MLQTQVNYWTLQENKRHNQETERLTDFSNREVQRHNLVAESQQNFYNTEVQRHNIASEGIGAQQARASLLQAQAAQSQAGASWYNARVNATVSEAQKGLLNAQTTERLAQAANTSGRTSYQASENVQGWFNTLGNVVGSIARLV